MSTSRKTSSSPRIGDSATNSSVEYAPIDDDHDDPSSSPSSSFTSSSTCSSSRSSSFLPQQQQRPRRRQDRNHQTAKNNNNNKDGDDDPQRLIRRADLGPASLRQALASLFVPTQDDSCQCLVIKDTASESKIEQRIAGLDERFAAVVGTNKLQRPFPKPELTADAYDLQGRSALMVRPVDDDKNKDTNTTALRRVNSHSVADVQLLALAFVCNAGRVELERRHAALVERCVDFQEALLTSFSSSSSSSASSSSSSRRRSRSQ